MPGTTRKAAARTYEVLISFNGLDVGERFAQGADDLGWASPYLKSGYLRDVTEEVPDVGRSEIGQG